MQIFARVRWREASNDRCHQKWRFSLLSLAKEAKLQLLHSRPFHSNMKLPCNQHGSASKTVKGAMAGLYTSNYTDYMDRCGLEKITTHVGHMCSRVGVFEDPIYSLRIAVKFL